MDLKQLEYIVAIEKCGNMTEAAEQLFITPSALSQQLIKLEAELGTQLFTRSRRHMIPTAAGTIYLKTAKKMLAMRQAAYSEIRNIAGCVTGFYRVGLTFEHGSDVFARIYPQFHRKYPGIQIRCYQFLVPEMLDMLANNQLDIAFILTGEPQNYDKVEYRMLSSENLLIGLPRSHPLMEGVEPMDYPRSHIDLKLLEEDEFGLALGSSTMRTELIDPIFAHFDFQPHIMIETSFNNFLEQLPVRDVCCSIVPQSRVHNYRDAHWFYMPEDPKFQFGVAYIKGYRLSSALEDFIDLAAADAQAHMNFPSPGRSD